MACGNCPITHLRAAIRANHISFPAPVPVFASEFRADIQWRLVELYFVRGWSPGRLAERYKITSSRVRQSLRSWVRRARTMGYLQPVPAAEDIRPALVFAVPATFAARVSISHFSNAAQMGAGATTSVERSPRSNHA